jgi:hypothetical protein
MIQVDNEYAIKTIRSKKMLVWLGVGSIAMFFMAFTSAYIVLQADHFWGNGHPCRVCSALALASSLSAA